jgi:hypothetical protein
MHGRLRCGCLSDRFAHFSFAVGSVYAWKNATHGKSPNTISTPGTSATPEAPSPSWRKAEHMPIRPLALRPIGAYAGRSGPRFPTSLSKTLALGWPVKPRGGGVDPARDECSLDEWIASHRPRRHHARRRFHHGPRWQNRDRSVSFRQPLAPRPAGPGGGGSA